VSGEYVVVAEVVWEFVTVAAVGLEVVAEQQVVAEAGPEHAEAFEDGTQVLELQVLGRTAQLVEDAIAAVAAPAEGIVHGIVNTAVAGDAAVLEVELLVLEQEVTATVEAEACESVVVDKVSPT
jgi:hypothetical protein